MVIDPDKSTHLLLLELAERSRSFIRSNIANFQNAAAQYSALAQLTENSSSPISLEQAFKNELFTANLCSRLVLLITGAFWNRVTKGLISNRIAAFTGMGKFRFINSASEKIQFHAYEEFIGSDFLRFLSQSQFWPVSCGNAILDDVRALRDFAGETENVAYLNDWCVPLFCYRLLHFVLPRLVARHPDSKNALANQKVNEFNDLERSFAFAIYISWISSLNLSITTQTSLKVEDIGIFYWVDDDVKFAPDPAFISKVTAEVAADPEQSKTAKTGQ